MSVSKVINQFNNKAYGKEWRPSDLVQKRVKKLISLVGTGNKVLDIGCYDGTIAKTLNDKGNDVLAIDIADSAIKLAKKKGVNAMVFNFEEDKLPKSMKDFDVVIAGEIIEHIFDTDGFIQKVGSVLKKNGSLILTTPNLAGLGARINLLMGKTPWMVENTLQGGVSGHIRYFTFETLEQLLNRNGFKVEKKVTESVGLGQSLSIPFFDKLMPSLGRIVIVKAIKK